MPAPRTAEQVRQEIDAERRELASAVDELRSSLGRTAKWFVLAGGVGAAVRHLARRRRG